jgi:uncharacterized membrane protein
MIHLLADPVVDWGALLKVVWVSVVGGIGLMAAFSFAVLGAVRASEYRRAESPIVAAAFTLLSLVCVLLCAAAIYQGFSFVINKS